MLFDNIMKWVDSFVPMDSEVVEGSKTSTEGSSKRAGKELESDKSKKQKIDEHVEAKVNDDQDDNMEEYTGLSKDHLEAIFFMWSAFYLLNKKLQGRIVGIKSLLNAASITAAHIRVNAA
ncbi:hypothetical protein Tco_0085737 [Tanacetum coccineum]